MTVTIRGHAADATFHDWPPPGPDRCERCDVEARHHRGRLCAWCALRDDLHDLLGGAPTEPALAGLVDALCAAGRPESIIVWKRSAKVQELLRAILQHHGLLPQRDQYLPRFEQWIEAKLVGLPDEVGQPVRHFATWHHLRRIRAKAAAGASTRGPVPSAKQEITETVKFLLWLFPGYVAGRHLHSNTVMDRLRSLGVNLLGARNRAIGELVLDCTPSLVADPLGYSHQVAFLHANKAAEPWARYAGRRISSP